MWKKLVEGQDPTEPHIVRRRSMIIHEAFLQMMITDKVKDSTMLPTEEWLKLNEVTCKIKAQFEKMKKYRNDRERIFNELVELTRYAIRQLGIVDWNPEFKDLSTSSYDQTFTEDYADQQNKSEKDVRKGIDTYFDEIVKVDAVCPCCGKHFVQDYGVKKS